MLRGNWKEKVSEPRNGAAGVVMPRAMVGTGEKTLGLLFVFSENKNE